MYLDPRGDEVAVPPWLARQPQLVLQVGLDLPVPIPDLRVDDEGVYGTLSFNRAPFTCSVPWSAVFALVGDDGMGMVWREDLPEEIAAEVELGLSRAGEAPEAPEARAPGPRLRAIEGGAARPDGDGDTEGDTAGDTAEDAPGPEGASRDGGTTDGEGGEGGEGDGSGRRLPPYLRVIK